MARHLIRDALLVDGTGTPPRRGDLLVDGDRIAAIGDLGHPDAHVIDGRGLALAPGFIDVHSHADYSLLAFPSADSAVRQGITTAVVGNCGLGVAPCHPGHDVRRVAMGVDEDWGVELGWSEYGEYLARIRGTAVNAAGLIAHGAVRNAVVGLAARPVSVAELAVMEQLVDDALWADGKAGRTCAPGRPPSGP